jgi:uncharacterized repeat protein (TIGR01451 family)
VYFGTKAATFTIQSNFKISAVVPAGATTAGIRIVTPAGSAFSPNNFVIAPTISGFSPAFGPVGTAVTITGVNLNASTPTVKFNGVAASTLSVTPTQVIAVVPVGATSGRISLTTSDGSDITGTAFFLPATLAGFSQTNSPPGSRVSITGQNLTGANAVRFNGTPATSFIVSNNNSMSAVVPANVVTGPISISTPAGAASSSAPFYGTPLISGFSPTHGLPGASVTVNGINFLGGTVQFAGTPAALLSLNNTQLVATVPNGAISGPITVTAPAGASTSINPFTFDYSSDLSIYITNSVNPVTLGSNLVYTITIDCRGPFDAPNATFTNLLPSSVALVSASISPPWVLATNNNLVTGSSTNFRNGLTSLLLVTVRPLTTGDITSSVSVSSDYQDPNPADNTASIVTTVTPQVLLSVDTFEYGVKISWPLALTNYTLETRDALTADSSWSVVSNAPIISGQLQFVLQTNTSSARFYRLHQ